jgi:hypothetical protein
MIDCDEMSCKASFTAKIFPIDSISSMELQIQAYWKNAAFDKTNASFPEHFTRSHPKTARQLSVFHTTVQIFGNKSCSVYVQTTEIDHYLFVARRFGRAIFHQQPSGPLKPISIPSQFSSISISFKNHILPYKRGRHETNRATSLC